MAEAHMVYGRHGDLPQLSSVDPGDGAYTVRVAWAEGARAGGIDLIDLASIILTHSALKALRDDRLLFASVRLSEHADAIEWGPDDTIAISGSTLERLAQEMGIAGRAEPPPGHYGPT